MQYQLSVVRFSNLSRLLLCLACAFCFAATPALGASGKTSHSATKVTAKKVAKARPDVNVNKAGVDELAEALIGVGPSKAKAIIAYRKKHGPFKTLADLGKVKGIGPATLKKNKSHIHF